jgi:hypothetical protein
MVGCASNEHASGANGHAESTSSASSNDSSETLPMQAIEDAAPSQVPAEQRIGCDIAMAIAFCGGGTCHYDGADEFGSDLALWDRDAQQLSEGLASRLVNVPASYHNVLTPEDCPSEPELLIDPVNVEQSLLISKLNGTHACGDEMPKFPYPEWGATNNPGDQREQLVECIRAWVLLVVEDYNVSL